MLGFLVFAAIAGLASSQCVDRVNPLTGVSDCPARASLCTNSAYFTLMTQQCPLTCGRCSSVATSATTVSTTCRDLLNPLTGVSDCPARAALCSNAAYSTLMTQQCPLTCGRCGVAATTVTSVTVSGTCVDLVNPATGVSDCPRVVALCTNSAYVALMQVQCRRTCGFCTATSVVATTASSTCVDLLNPNTGVSDCPNVAFLCNNSAYATLMTQQCPRTCGRCIGK